MFSLSSIYVSVMLLDSTLHHIQIDDRFTDAALASYVSPMGVVLPTDFVVGIPWACVTLYVALSCIVLCLPSLYDDAKRNLIMQNSMFGAMCMSVLFMVKALLTRMTFVPSPLNGCIAHHSEMAHITVNGTFAFTQSMGFLTCIDTVISVRFAAILIMVWFAGQLFTHDTALAIYHTFAAPCMMIVAQGQIYKGFNYPSDFVLTGFVVGLMLGNDAAYKWFEYRPVYGSVADDIV